MTTEQIICLIIGIPLLIFLGFNFIKYLFKTLDGLDELRKL